MRLRSCLLLLVAFGVGCSSDGPFDYVPVSGRVTYEDGSPLPPGVRLIFSAQDAPPVENAYPRPAMANLSADGHFSAVTSYQWGDGLIPGKHKVVIQAEAQQGAPPIVPKDYTDLATTPLIVDTDDAPFDIKVPKP